MTKSDIRMLWVGDTVETPCGDAKVIAIRKCQPDGHCIHGLDGINTVMITEKIVVVCFTKNGVRDFCGTEIRKVLI